MKAVRLHGYNQMPIIDDVPEPSIKSPLDVIVKIGGAGVCRTDLHIILGQWAEAMNQSLPYTLGHENAGWVHEVGSAVTNVAGRRHGYPAPDADLRPVPCLSGRSGHALRQQLVPGPRQRRRDG
jgi:D-arabinose 1-dehydrogenase-like Zn-dependent alcohol dehydrogenase